MNKTITKLSILSLLAIPATQINAGIQNGVLQPDHIHIENDTNTTITVKLGGALAIDGPCESERTLDPVIYGSITKAHAKGSGDNSLNLVSEAIKSGETLIIDTYQGEIARYNQEKGLNETKDFIFVYNEAAKPIGAILYPLQKYGKSVENNSVIWSIKASDLIKKRVINPYPELNHKGLLERVYATLRASLKSTPSLTIPRVQVTNDTKKELEIEDATNYRVQINGNWITAGYQTTKSYAANPGATVSIDTPQQSVQDFVKDATDTKKRALRIYNFESGRNLVGTMEYYPSTNSVKTVDGITYIVSKPLNVNASDIIKKQAIADKKAEKEHLERVLAEVKQELKEARQMRARL